MVGKDGNLGPLSEMILCVEHHLCAEDLGHARHKLNHHLRLFKVFFLAIYNPCVVDPGPELFVESGTQGFFRPDPGREFNLIKIAKKLAIVH
jgi:hypothetical protein